MADVIIRALDKQDGPALDRLHASLSPLDRERYSFLNNRRLADFIGPEFDLALAAFLDDELVCLGHLERSPNKHVTRLGIIVHGQHRGKGVGRAMMEALLNGADAIGIEKVTLRVRSDNVPALRLYESLGFRPEGAFLGEEVRDGTYYDYYSLALWLPRSERSIGWSRPVVGAQEFSEVVNVFQADWYSQGQATKDFEQALAERVGAKHVVAMNNGTAALIAAISCSFPKNCRVAVPTYTHVSTANAVLAAGMTPVFCDVDANTGLLDVKSIPRNVDAVLPVDLCGHPFDPRVIDSFDVPVVEDAAQAIGAEARGVSVGAGKHPVVFSFHAAKLLTTVEGGAVATSDDDLAERLRRFRNHGETSKFVWGEFGLNFRFTDLQAAIGLAQVARLDDFMAHRKSVVDAYKLKLSRLAFQHTEAFVTRHPYMMCMVQSGQRAVALAALDRAGVAYRNSWAPVHLQPSYDWLRGGSLPQAEALAERAFYLPLSSDMTRQETARVIEVLNNDVV